MQLDQTDPRPLATARMPLGGLPADPTYCEWGALVGGRIRRLRRRRRMTLTDFGHALMRPDGSCFSAGFVSRLERGRSAAPLYVYLAIADVLEVDPGVLLGPEAAALDVTEGEAVLLRYLRQVGIEPHEAIVRLSARSP
jgi:transcriptional regulator with XRE-family HTH domain